MWNRVGKFFKELSWPAAERAPVTPPARRIFSDSDDSPTPVMREHLPDVYAPVPLHESVLYSAPVSPPAHPVFRPFHYEVVRAAHPRVQLMTGEKTLDEVLAESPQFVDLLLERSFQNRAPQPETFQRFAAETLGKPPLFQKDFLTKDAFLRANLYKGPLTDYLTPYAIFDLLLQVSLPPKLPHHIYFFNLYQMPGEAPTFTQVSADFDAKKMLYTLTFHTGDVTDEARDYFSEVARRGFREFYAYLLHKGLDAKALAKSGGEGAISAVLRDHF
jgi:hypothetical protein